MINIIQGNALEIIKSFAPNTFDAIITDPPYSSGGTTNTTRGRSTAEKYTNTKKHCPYPSFPGDSKDQRSWANWCAEWLSACRAVSKDGAVACIFIDWRQLPSLTDAIQWADWTWRGIVVWDKINARPQKGRFKQDAEFVVWASNGQLPAGRLAPILPGCYHYSMPQAGKRLHQTQIVRVCEANGHILDPFCGSGTTLEAAQLEGYDCTGIEMLPHYADAAKRRLGLM